MQDRNWQADMRSLREREKKAPEILGVSEAAGRGEIKAAWRRKSLSHHPDRNDGSVESHRRFILINSAYRCLTQGEGCEALDSESPAGKGPTQGKYRLDNPWGYFVWWRDNYFE
jgi:DnaJ-class molecular chaperone